MPHMPHRSGNWKSTNRISGGGENLTFDSVIRACLRDDTRILRANKNFWWLWTIDLLLKRNQLQNPAQLLSSADSQLSAGALTVPQLLELTEHKSGQKRVILDTIFVDTPVVHSDEINLRLQPVSLMSVTVCFVSRSPSGCKKEKASQSIEVRRLG